jgi:hypothetical protein
MNPLCTKNLKTNYNVTPYGDHVTERVKVMFISFLQALQNEWKSRCVGVLGECGG